MKQLLYCRRTFIALLALGSLVLIALYNHCDTSMAVASVAGLLASANAAESAMKSKYENTTKD